MFYLAPYLYADSVVFSSTVCETVARKVAVSSEVILCHVSVSSTPFFWIMKNRKSNRKLRGSGDKVFARRKESARKTIIKTEIKHVF